MFFYCETSSSDGVAMSSPLGPVLAGIFMVDLKRSLIPLHTAA